MGAPEHAHKLDNNFVNGPVYIWNALYSVLSGVYRNGDEFTKIYNLHVLHC